MKKWNKPELAVVEISETAKNDKINHAQLDITHYSNGICTATGNTCNRGGGKGICNTCQYCNCDSNNLESFS